MRSAESENKGPDAVLVRSLLNVNPPDFVEAATRARKALGGLWYEVLKDAIDVDFDRIAALLSMKRIFIALYALVRACFRKRLTFIRCLIC